MRTRVHALGRTIVPHAVSAHGVLYVIVYMQENCRADY